MWHVLFQGERHGLRGGSIRGIGIGRGAGDGRSRCGVIVGVIILDQLGNPFALVGVVGPAGLEIIRSRHVQFEGRKAGTKFQAGGKLAV